MTRSTQRDLPRVDFVNSSGEEIPAYAVLRIDDTDPSNNHELKAFKPTGSASGATFAINAGRKVAATKRGKCTKYFSCWALFVKESGSDPDPQPGDTVGPGDDWALHAGKTGFKVVGGYEAYGSGFKVRVEPEASASGNVVYAQVNEASGVADSDPTFTANNAIAIVGEAPVGDFTAQNQYGQVYANDEWVILHQRQDNDQWITERGGTAGSLVIRFELIQDKRYSDSFAEAKPVDLGGELDDEADMFHVLDPDPDGEGEGIFYGLASYTDGASPAAIHNGYRGFAVKLYDANDELNIPAGYMIIAMEGPADEIVVELTEDSASSQTKCNLISGDNAGPWGEPFGARMPKIENTLWDLIVRDDLDIADAAKQDDKWIVRWSRAQEHYTFWRPLIATGPTVVKSVVLSGSTRSTERISMSGDIELVCGGPLPEGEIFVKCDPKVNHPAGATVYARFDDTANDELAEEGAEYKWTTADAGNFVWHLRGLEDGYGASRGPIEDPGNGNDPHYADAGPCSGA